METISSYFVVLVIFQWKAIEICFCRHCLMESGIKHTYLRYIWHKLGAYTDTDQVSRIVKWCKVIALCDRSFYFRCYNYRFCKLFSAVNNTMSDCSDFVKALNNTCICICQRAQAAGLFALSRAIFP